MTEDLPLKYNAANLGQTALHPNILCRRLNGDTSCDPYEDLSARDGWMRPVTHIAPKV